LKFPGKRGTQSAMEMGGKKVPRKHICAKLEAKKGKRGRL